jgi:type VI secretion system protein ImpA
MAVSESDVSASPELLNGAAPVALPIAPAAPELAIAAAASSVATPAVATAPAAPLAPAAPALDPAVAALCAPISDADPCGPDLDFEGDADYLNFVAQAEGVLPNSFFSPEDGKPFDRTTIDFNRQFSQLQPLMARTRDIRLLILQARLQILNRDLSGFAVSLAATAEWLEKFWNSVHPRAQDGDFIMRQTAITAFDLPTVVFALQYSPLLEGRRTGPIAYRGLMIAMGEVKARSGEVKQSPSVFSEAVSNGDPTVVAAARKTIASIKTSLDRIRNAFAVNGLIVNLENLPPLVSKILAFIDPHRASGASDAAEDRGGAEATKDGTPTKTAGAAPSSLADASAALAAIAAYYSHCEPSSPTLPLVRQAHQLIGKSFIEVLSVLVPTQMEKAAFLIGGDQVFELPVGKLLKLSEVSPQAAPSPPASSGGGGGAPTNPAATPATYRVESRGQAIALLDQVQRWFRHAEPSSPIPMLCDRARALAERDFMGVLRDVLPKAALKNAIPDK